MTNISTITLETIKSAIKTPHYYNKFRVIHSILNQITFPYLIIIVCIGLITNTLTIVFLSKDFVTKNLGHKWTLIALAFSDLIHNISLLIRVIHDIISGKIEYLCLIISFLSHLAELLSACFTVLFTVQRYTAVRYPLKAAVQEKSSPIIRLLLIFMFSLIFCIVLSHTNTYIDCHEELKLSWFIADALSSFVIPFSLILIYNIFIVNLIRKHARSPFSVQSTLLKSNKRVRNGIHYNFRKRNRSKDSSSITYSHGIPHTSHEILFETDIDKKISRTCSSIKSYKSSPAIKRSQPRSSCNISNETEFQTSEIPIPMEQIEEVNLNASPVNGSSLISDQSTRLDRDKKNKYQQRISNALSSRRLSQLAQNVDFISNKNSQTTQSIRVTRMLVLVSTCFLILNAPAHLFIIALKIYTIIDLPVYDENTELDKLKQITNLTNNQMKNFVFIQNKNYTTSENKHLLTYDTNMPDDQIIVHILYLAVLLTQLISYASYSINFFLYSFIGGAFRTRMRQLFNKLC
ncbi:unnamed protein product [Rotaria sordida]|uniref:G-protein coupled receptors family 1 profile domain-containing protein n=1 Tax=Rotaria sordida TaxID=392033 RepID=A0A814DDX6_9BILA|nr:unnamed protein product [Rotaria sordida]